MSRVSIRPISSRSWSAWPGNRSTSRKFTPKASPAGHRWISPMPRFDLPSSCWRCGFRWRNSPRPSHHGALRRKLRKWDGVYNAIQLVGDASKTSSCMGVAGSMPTGSASCKRCDVHRARPAQECDRRVPPASYQPDQRRPLRMRPMEEITSLYYIRFMVLDRPGVLSQIAGSWVVTSVFPRCCSRDARKGRPCRS